MTLDKPKNGSLIPILDFLRLLAKKEGRPKYECLADWISKIPEGFSCARAVSSVREGCKEIYEPADCGNFFVKIADNCSGKIRKLKSCPETFMVDENLKTKYCREEQGDSWPYEGTGNWVIKTRRTENYDCCCNSNDCCNDCFSWPYLGT